MNNIDENEECLDKHNCNSDNCDCEQCDCNNEEKCCEDCSCEDCGCENKTEVEQDFDQSAEQNIDNLENNDTNVEDEDTCKCGCGEELEQSDIYFGQLLSLRAEFDNFRKRTQEDISKAFKNGFNEAISEFLPALDSFKMATDMITDQNTLMGIQYIEKGILSTLEKMGVSVIDTTGKFDPDFHQAIGSETKEGFESGYIIKECFKGFKMGDKIIRYAQVIVAK